MQPKRMSTKELLKEWENSGAKGLLSSNHRDSHYSHRFRVVAGDEALRSEPPVD